MTNVSDDLVERTLRDLDIIAKSSDTGERWMGTAANNATNIITSLRIELAAAEAEIVKLKQQRAVSVNSNSFM